MKVLRITFFNSDPWGNGGDRRTAQLTEILHNAQINEECIKFWDYYEEIFNQLNFTKLQVWKIGYLLLSKFGLLKVLLKVKKPYNFLANVGVTFLITQKLLSKFSFDLIILENTKGNLWYLPFCFSYLKIKFIAVPHNLEALVPGQVSLLSHKSSPYWLKEEIVRLAIASKVFTISREEAWLLNLYQIRSSYLPYWPSKEMYSTLIQIRNERINSKKEGGLIIGTVGNPPTYNGMLQIINYFIHQEKPSNNIYIAGYGTETFKTLNGIKEQSSLKIFGEVSDEQIKCLYKKVKFVIINQQNSSGALTKIIEFLIAGIPIIIDQFSSRTYHQQKGIYTFYALNQINSYFNKELETPPLPNYPEAEVNNFIMHLRQV